MAVLRLHQNDDRLWEQIGKLEKALKISAPDILVNYITSLGIESADEITIQDVYSYRNYIDGLSMTLRQKKYYKALIEQLVYYGCKDDYGKLMKYADINTSEVAALRKVVSLLIIFNVTSPEEMNYEIRERVVAYIKEAVVDKKFKHEKVFDQIKLNWIRLECEDHPLSQRELKFRNEKLFLLYHPDYGLAMTFYYVQNKSELVFDFSAPASEKMKKQIFQMLQYVLGNKKILHDRRERFLIPLNLFYKFCIDENIEDVELLLKSQKEAFKESMRGKVGTKEKVYIQIVDNIKKLLFLNSKETNWDATTWFLERFSFDRVRVNPSREILSFDFADIEITYNRKLFQEYMRYLVGVETHLAIQSVRNIYENAKRFVKFLEEKQYSLDEYDPEILEEFINHLRSMDISWIYFNQIIIDSCVFLRYVAIRHDEVRPCFDIAYYLKKGFTNHNNRSVDEKVQQEILGKLKYMPHKFRLMYMHLWTIGLRVSEVCTVRRDAYVYDGENAWIKIYQPKMKAEKMVPIPIQLYKLMTDYIAKTDGKPDDYIFKSAKGKAYDAGTFSKQFKELLVENGVEGYSFKAHDFRHTIGTRLRDNNVPIETIRDYLGHKDSDMTRQYLDYAQKRIDELNREYFAKGGKTDV